MFSTTEIRFTCVEDIISNYSHVHHYTEFTSAIASMKRFIALWDTTKHIVTSSCSSFAASFREKNIVSWGNGIPRRILRTILFPLYAHFSYCAFNHSFHPLVLSSHFSTWNPAVPRSFPRSSHFLSKSESREKRSSEKYRQTRSK
mgnify:CR=1 FL=1